MTIGQGKDDGLHMERNALHDNWDDADGYYSKFLLHFVAIKFCPFTHFLHLQLTGLVNCWMAVMKSQQRMGRACSQQSCGQKILKLGKTILKKSLLKLFATMKQCRFIDVNISMKL
jgi:hypothetical protein